MRPRLNSLAALFIVGAVQAVPASAVALFGGMPARVHARLTPADDEHTPARRAQKKRSRTREAQQSSEGLEVTVHDVRLLRSALREPSVASTVIGAKELAEPGMTLGRALARVPGVELLRSGAQADFVSASLRGATSAQTPVYLAGIRLNDEVGGAADLSLVPVWLLERIEVYRGNAPEHADELGMGGAIFAEPELPHTATWRAGALLGSFGEKAGFARATAGDRVSQTTLAARVHGADNEYEFHHDNGTRFVDVDDTTVLRKNADFLEYDVWAIHRLRAGRGRVTLLVNALDREQGVTGLSLAPAEHARQHTRRLLFGASGAAPCAQSEEACRLELSTGVKLVESQIDDRLGELAALLTPHASVSGRRLHQRAALTLGVHPDFTLGISGAGAIDTLGIDRFSSPSTAAQRRTLRAALSPRVDVTEWWSLHGLFVSECHGTSGPTSSSEKLCDAFEPLGRVGSVIDVASGVELLGNVGRYVRLPTLGELYGTSPVVRGNDELETETAWSGDLGVRVATERSATNPWALGLEAFAFARDTEHLIGYRRASLGIVRPYNLASARMLGAELSAIVDLFRHVRIGSTATLLDARDTTPSRGLRNDVLPFRSRLVFGPSLEVYTDAGYEALDVDSVTLRVSSLYRSSRYADHAGLVVLEPQTTFDAALALRLFDDTLGAGVSVENALDARYLDIIGLPLPGRAVYLNLESGW